MQSIVLAQPFVFRNPSEACKTVHQRYDFEHAVVSTSSGITRDLFADATA